VNAAGLISATYLEANNVWHGCMRALATIASAKPLAGVRSKPERKNLKTTILDFLPSWAGQLHKPRTPIQAAACIGASAKLRSDKRPK